MKSRAEFFKSLAVCSVPFVSLGNMNRLGLLHPSQLDAEAKRLYDAYVEYTTNRYGKA